MYTPAKYLELNAVTPTERAINLYPDTTSCGQQLPQYPEVKRKISICPSGGWSDLLWFQLEDSWIHRKGYMSRFKTLAYLLYRRGLAVSQEHCW